MAKYKLKASFTKLSKQKNYKIYEIDANERNIKGSIYLLKKKYDDAPDTIDVVVSDEAVAGKVKVTASFHKETKNCKGFKIDDAFKDSKGVVGSVYLDKKSKLEAVNIGVSFEFEDEQSDDDDEDESSDNDDDDEEEDIPKKSKKPAKVVVKKKIKVRK